MTFSRRNHTLLLGFFLLLLAAPLIFPHTPANGIIWCPLRASTGVECAGCGMTRSWIALTHGRILESLHVHPLGLLLYLAAAFKAATLVVELRLGRRLDWPRWTRYRVALIALVAAAFVVLGVIRATHFLLSA